MKCFPLGVAGHVDHGKTSLVKALTSIDTDRLPEEKRRGMSIDIGFAFLDFPEDSLRVEIIDIPGHERFIKNAICGLAPVWGLMLVVDAGEGVMPQTVEHLRITKGFGMERVLLVLTKIDRVDPSTVELASEEASDLIKKEGLDLFGVYGVSSITGEGIEGLKLGIKEYAKESIKDRENWLFRFYIDSAFSVKGYGTVVRGSCVSGRVEEGDLLTLEPLGLACRVKRLQNHGSFVKEGKAGERLALNIPELEPDKVERGHFLVKGIKSSKRLIVRLEGQRPKGIGYTFFGMREVPFSSQHILEDYYLLKLSEPVPCIRWDRGPILDSSGEMVGSYEVVHPIPTRTSKRFLRESLDLLKEDPIQYLLLERGLKGLILADLFSFYGHAINPPNLPRLKDTFYHPKSLEEIAKRIKEILSTKEGIVSLSELLSRLGVSEDVLKLALSGLKDVKVVEGYLFDAKRARLEDLKGYKELMDLLSQGIREERELEAYKEYLSMAVRKGQVYSLGDYLYISKKLFESYVERLKAIGKEFSIREAKEALGLTRKYLIPLLEHMDRLGITRREEERRVFLR